jgi:tellurite resistance protein
MSAETDRELRDPPGADGRRAPPTPAAASRGGGRLARLAAIPPTFFAIAFGLGGLGATWRAAEPMLDVPGAVADALYLLAAAVWAVLVVGVVVRLVRTPRAIAAQLRDPVVSPFMALPAIVALVLAAGLYPHAATPARVVALVALAVVIALGGWLTGQWIAGTVDMARMHPGYFLPTVAGGFVGANTAAVMGYRTIAWLSFGIGVICWMQLGSTILNRLFMGPPLVAALVPTLAIEVAPPAVGGNAYFALHQGGDDLVLYVLAGFCVLSIIVQVRLLPLFLALRFAPTFWSFTFSYTAVATFALHWIAHGHPGQDRLLAWITLAGMTLFVAAIATWSVRAVAAGRFFPALPAAPAPEGA